MISWAIRRKFFVISVVFLILAIGAYGGYQVFLKKPPSCFNNKQDGNEGGVDCGGSCSKLCSSSIKNLIMRWDPRLLKVSEGNYSVIVYFENPNVNASVKNMPYTIKVLGEKEAVLAERKGQTSIPNHATFAILETNIKDLSGTPVKASFVWNDVLNWQRDDAPIPEIVIENKTFTDIETKPRIDALLLNKSLSDIPALELVAIVTDGAGNVVGASKTLLKEILRGSSNPITFTWPMSFTTTKDVCENPVDVALLMDRSQSIESALGEIKFAAINFLSELKEDDKVGIISFADSASSPSDFPLSSDRNSAKVAIENIVIDPKTGQNTNIADAFVKSKEMLELAKTSERKQIVVLITDGLPNIPTKKGVVDYPQIVSQDEARKLKDMGTTIFSIGLGDKVNSDFLRSISSGKDNFFVSPSVSNLQQIYSSIAKQICVKKPVQIDIVPRITEDTGI